MENHATAATMENHATAATALEKDVMVTMFLLSYITDGLSMMNQMPYTTHGLSMMNQMPCTTHGFSMNQRLRVLKMEQFKVEQFKVKQGKPSGRKGHVNKNCNERTYESIFLVHHIRNFKLKIKKLFFKFKILYRKDQNLTYGYTRFGASSASLARKFEDIKADLPHDHIPTNITELEKVDQWGMDYALSIVKVVGTGFALAFLSIIVGVLYGIFKLMRMCCCPRKESDYDDEDEHETSYYVKRLWVPSGLYGVAFVFLLTGMIIGVMNNPVFTDGVQDLGDYVMSIGDNALELGDGLVSSIDDIVALIPTSVDNMLDQMAGIPHVADEVVELGNDVNSTSTQVKAITDKVGAIDVGNTGATDDLYNQLTSINNQSQQIITQVSNLTYQVADKLRSSVDDAVSNLNTSMADINEHVDEITDTARGVMDNATYLVDKLDKYVNMVKDNDNQYRRPGVTALFSLVIAISFSFFVGYLIGVKVVLNVVSGFGFVFLFLLWFSGSIHFLLGIALSDVCPIVDVVVQGVMKNDTEASRVLLGCLYEHRSVLESLNITAFNLSDVFDYNKEFDEFNNFAEAFNFTTIDTYFAKIRSLYSYNLTAVANNLTAESFGWNQSVIYTALDELNDNTTPDVFGLNNYTTADPQHYPYPRNESVAQLQSLLTTLIQTNTTVYNRLAQAQADLISSQHDIDVLLSNYTAFDVRYSGIKLEVNTTLSENVTRIINIIDKLQDNITAFFELGNCSFLGETYRGILVSLCGTMQPAIDLLTVAQFLAGIALIPMVIIAEVLSFRVAGSPSMLKTCSNSVDEEGGTKKGDKCDYATVSKNSGGVSHVSRPALSATIASGDSTTNNSPTNRRSSGGMRPIQMPYE